MGIRSRKIASARMVFFILAFVFGVAFFGFKTNQAHAAYQYYRSITVTSTPSIASGTQTSFPMLVSSTVSSWESSAHGGHIHNLCTAPNGGQEPCDLVFATSSANCNGTPLNFETESYASSTGALVDWVNVPSVSTGTAIYACYDNNSVNTDQSHPASTWNSNYQIIYHLGDDAATATIFDSTNNMNNAASTQNTALTSVAGIIGRAQSFNGTNQAASSSYEITGSQGTIEAWAYDETSNPSSDYSLIVFGEVGTSMNINSGYFTGDWSIDACGTGINSGIPVQANVWTNIVGTYDGSTAKIYINGSLATSTSISCSFDPYPQDTGTMSVGYDSKDNAYFFHGNVDEGRLSTSARSASWIATEYNNESSPATFYTIGS